MHSPDGSSSASTDSETGSPPPEEHHAPSVGTPMLDITAQIQRTLQGSKRRLPGGPSFGSSSNRDPKSRRRGDHGPRGAGVGQSSSVAWAESAMEKGSKSREERDVVDVGLVEQLRKEIGDPFLEKRIA